MQAKQQQTLQLALFSGARSEWMFELLASDIEVWRLDKTANSNPDAAIHLSVKQKLARGGEKTPEHDTHVLQGLKVRAGAVNLSDGEILYRPVLGSKFGSKNEAMQDFVASFLFRSSATAEVLHVQLATPIVKCEHAWKLRKINVALMFNHKRSHPRTLAACGIMSIMIFFAAYNVITIKILWTLCVLYCHYHHGIIASIWVILPLSS